MSATQNYLENLNKEQRGELERIRRITMQTVPEAEEAFSYGIPLFKYKQEPLLWFAAFRNHFSIFPTAEPIEALRDKLAGYRLSKGTIQFTKDKPIPDSLLKQVINCRRKEIDSLKQHN